MRLSIVLPLPSLPPSLPRLQVAWEKMKQYSTDLDSNAKNDRMYLTLSCRYSIPVL